MAANVKARLTDDFARRLPRSARFRAHARRLAELAARGEVDRVLGYLDALHTDWQATSSSFDRARYAEFESHVAAAAYQHRCGERAPHGKEDEHK